MIAGDGAGRVVLTRCAAYAAVAGVCAYVLERAYDNVETRKAIDEIERSDMANLVQYFPEAFRFYWITNALWLDLALIAGFSFAVSAVLLGVGGRRKSAHDARRKRWKLGRTGGDERCGANAK